jgi:flagellar hook-associated protein 1 FlgK
MANLLASLNVTAGALNAFDLALETSQNNVANAQTPGFVAQTQTLDSLAFNLSAGEIGGVTAGPITSARDQFAEQNVHNQNMLLGAATQDVNSLSQLQNLFPVSDSSGIANALNTLYSSFSGWAENPNDSNARQSVMDDAATVASTFQSTAQGLTQFTQDTNQNISDTVASINQLAAQLTADNQQIQQGNGGDAGLDANVHNTLDQLSQYVNFTATQQSDGTYVILVDGQTPIVMGNQQFSLGVQMTQPTNPPPVNANAPPHVSIIGADGADITTQVTGGQLGSLVNLRNTVLPTYIGDAYQSGSINTLAQQFADSVNNLLTSGNVTDGPPAQAGAPLFTYDASNSTNVASTLAVNPAITGAQLAAIQPGPPEVANGIALSLAGLSNPSDPADEINGQSYTAYYAGIAAGVGTALNEATNSQTDQQAAAAQAQNLRQQASGVNLDQEAVNLVQFQKAYEANSRFVTVIDTLASDLINMVATTAS